VVSILGSGDLQNELSAGGVRGGACKIRNMGGKSTETHDQFTQGHLALRVCKGLLPKGAPQQPTPELFYLDALKRGLPLRSPHRWSCGQGGRRAECGWGRGKHIGDI